MFTLESAIRFSIYSLSVFIPIAAIVVVVEIAYFQIMKKPMKHTKWLVAAMCFAYTCYRWYYSLGCAHIPSIPKFMALEACLFPVRIILARSLVWLCHKFRERCFPNFRLPKITVQVTFPKP